MKQPLSAVLSVLLMLGSASATSAAPNGYQTEAISSTEFEVIPRARKDVDGYWCAAADFARRSLGAGWQQRIYVLRGYGPSVTTGRRTAVQFTLKAPANTDQQSSISVGFKAGESMSVQGANGRCSRRIRFN
ncbi:hypothetical protein [uncultured Ruegeria sp.]|uniref:hypothetical protein n=1 Tax=uncultured Ruegeria sp. TaxID=259304 RepID=UPI0026318574|nr:hypothetical protein [uncultured Ruegeria sp.]